VDELYVRSRRSLLDALEALAAHRDGVILIGALPVPWSTQGVGAAHESHPIPARQLER